MNIAIGIFLCALTVALVAEWRRYRRDGARGNAYQLIDLQREIQQRKESDGD